MGTLDTTVLDRDLQNVAAHSGAATLVWTNPSGTEETIDDAMKGEIERSDDVELEGQFENRDLRILVRTGQFSGSDYPEIGDKLQLDSVWYRVESRSLSVDEVQLRLDLKRTS